MKIDLANLAGAPGAHGRYQIREQLEAIDGTTVVGPVTGELTVQNTGALLVVRGWLRARISTNCVRCLAPVEQALDIAVEEEFAAEGATPDIDTVDRESPAESAIEDFVLDAGELVRQQISINAPMATVCRAECQGICPTCGKNLNEGPCACQPEVEEGPFTKLKDLLPGVGTQEGPGRQA